MDYIEKLKRCPFCGGKAEQAEYSAYSVDSSFYYIGCIDCGAMIMDGTPEEWNKREVV